jgi:hypothetical protein
MGRPTSAWFGRVNPTHSPPPLILSLWLTHERDLLLDSPLLACDAAGRRYLL